MQTVVLEGQTFGFEDTGGDGPAIVFSHAFGTDGTLFTPQVEAFAGRWRCVTWDQRAHGASPTDGPYTMWDSAEDLLRLLDHLDVGPAALVGTSQGGFISLRAALLAPHRFSAMAILGSSAAAEDPGQKEAFLALGEAFGSGGNAGPPEEVLDAMVSICFGDYAEGGPWREIWRAWPPDQMRLALQSLVERDGLLDRLGEIEAPVLVLHGSEDRSYSPEEGRRIAEAVANSEDFVLVDGGAHFLSATNPGPVNDAVGPFLEKHR